MNSKMGEFHQKWPFSGTRLVECGWTWCFCFLFNCVCHPCDIFVTWKIARKVHLPEVSFLLISGILLYAYGIVGMRSNHSDPLLVRFFVLISVLILILALDLGRRRLKTDQKWFDRTKMHYLRISFAIVQMFPRLLVSNQMVIRSCLTSVRCGT